MSAARKTAKKAAATAARTVNELRDASGINLTTFAEQIDEHLSFLHAAVLHMQGEFVVPPAKACEIIESAINGIRWETATMRRAGLGLGKEASK
jgi:hypothetical protein